MKKLLFIALCCLSQFCWGQNWDVGKGDTSIFFNMRPLILITEATQSNLCFEFFQSMNEVSVQIYDEINRLMYTEFVGSPLQGDTYPIFVQLESGLYYVEIRYNGNKYYGQTIWIE